MGGGGTLRVAALRFECVALEPIRWNSFPSSVVHGRLGQRVRALTCVDLERLCEACRLNAECGYGYAFQSARSDGAPSRPQPTLPAPHIVCVDPWHVEAAAPQDRFAVELRLFGRATGYAQLFALAMREALEGELGAKHPDGRRGRAQVESVADPLGGVRFSRAADECPWPPPRVGRIRVAAGLAEPPVERFCLRWITPLRIVEDGKVVSAPSFRGIVAALLRRLSSLIHHHEGPSPGWDYRALVELAARADVDASWTRIPMRRYSARQQQAMRLDGVLGTMTVRGPATALLPLFRLGRLCGVGKNTTLGFGQFEILVDPSDNASRIEGAP